MRGADITFVVLTKDEGHNIADCLRSLPDGSHALVYDAQSTDDTVALAQSLGAAVIQAPWAGYVAARTAAAALVNTPWIFMLDADERLTIALRDALAALEPAAGVTAYSVPRRNWFCGQWVRAAGWWPDRQIRLFRTGQARVVPRSGESGAPVHETWRVQGECRELSEPLEHYTYRTLDDYRRKFERYTDIEAQAAAPSALAYARSCLFSPARFLWLLFGRGGFADGWRGIYVCARSAAYPVVVRAKAQRLRRARPIEQG